MDHDHYNENILVLIMGGTINADHNQTEKIIKNGQPMTNVKPYRDHKGRLPVQLFLEDTFAPFLKQCIGYNPFSFIEIADCDSKALNSGHFARMFDEINNASETEYSKILLILGTDLAAEIGRIIERTSPVLPIIMITAMQEMTRDMHNGQFFTDAPWETDGIANLMDAIGKPITAGVHLRAADGLYYPPSLLAKNFVEKKFKPKSLS